MRSHLQAAHPLLHPLVVDCFNISQKGLLGALLWSFFLAFQLPAFAQAAAPEIAQKLPDPIAYCLSKLEDCTPEKQQKFEGKVPGDLRAVNGGTQDPVTLVYALPTEHTQSGNYALLVAPKYIDYCFRFENAKNVACGERKLTQIAIPVNATLLYSQAVQIPDVRIKLPNVLWGTTQALQKQMLQDRDTIKLLNGWFLFIGIASLFQLLTHRSQRLSLCLSLMMACMIIRINTASVGGFSGIEFTTPETSRMLEYLTIPLLVVLTIQYFSLLVEKVLARTRRVLFCLCAAISVFIVFAEKPYHIFLSLQLTQIVLPIACFIGLFIVWKVIKTIERNQSFVMLLSALLLSVTILGDMYTTFQNLPLLWGTGLTPYGLAIESLCQYILIALRNNAAHTESEALAAQLQISQQEIAANRDEIAQKNEALKELDRMKDQFIATVSHELRTPIHGLNSMTEVLLNNNELPLTMRKPLHAWVEASERLSQLVGNIIDFSDLQQGQLHVQLQDVDVLQLLQPQLQAAQAALRGTPVLLVNSIPPDIPLVRADPHRVTQILEQMLSNAIQFTQGGEIELRCLLHTDPGQSGTEPSLEIVVMDTGCGMSTEKLAQVFATFSQGDGSDNRLSGGTGMGLSLSSRMALAMGGKLSLHSTPNVGTTVRLQLNISNTPRKAVGAGTPANEAEEPVATAVEAYESDSSDRSDSAPQTQCRQSDALKDPSQSTTPSVIIDAQPMPMPQPGSPPRVLIVDDDATNRMVLREQLSEAGYQWVEAEDGIDGLEKFQTEGPFDCVLLDVMMPRMNGLQACSQLRLNYNKTELPVFMLSAKVQTRDIVAGFDAGANDYLPKPFAKVELLARLHTHIGVSRTSRAMGRFIPRPFIELIGRQHVTEVVLGDSVHMPMAVLFSDFRGFSSVAEGKSAPELFGLLNAFYSQIAPQIRWHGGFVDKYIGDGMMALFPGGGQDAMAAAAAMLQAVQGLSEQHGMAMGIGVHCGATMLGTVGEPQRFDTTVISDVVNTASRLESATKWLGADILVSNDVLNSMSTATELPLRPLGKLRFKGKSELLEVVELLPRSNHAQTQAKLAHKAEFVQALDLIAQTNYALARVHLSHIVKLCPWDAAAQLYLDATIAADEGQANTAFDRGALILQQK